MTSCLQVAVGVLLAEERGNDEVVEMPYEALRKLRPTEILLRCVKPRVLPGSFTRSGSLRALGIRPKAHTHWHSVMWHDMHAHASSHAHAYTHPDVHTHTLADTSAEEHTRISHAQ